MRRHLHHLNALRFFEAAARHLSFTQAASELCVTQAAVSHQIRALEADLGQRLFVRAARQVRLTPAGERLVGVLSASFDRIDGLLAELKAQASSTTRLRLALTPTFSSRWLMPRLPRFWAAHPQVELHLHHTTAADPLATAGADAAVVWALEAPPDRLWARRLFGTGLTPVCSPGLPRQDAPLDSPAAIGHYPLLHEDSTADWSRWMHAAGVGEEGTRPGQSIDDTNALLMAAIAGQGLALGRVALIQDDLRSGRLLRPFELAIPALGDYWLVAPPSIAALPAWRVLADFLETEAEGTRRKQAAGDTSSRDVQSWQARTVSST